MINYFLGNVIGLDQQLNALIGGDPDEMVSARAHRRAVEGSKFWAIAERVIDAMFFWQVGHCKGAADYENSVVIEKYNRIKNANRTR